MSVRTLYPYNPRKKTPVPLCSPIKHGEDDPVTHRTRRLTRSEKKRQRRERTAAKVAARAKSN